MKIRSYRTMDRSAVESIHFETGFLGKSMHPFLSNNNLWKKDIEYYLSHEPKGIFVLVNDKNKIVGYIFGTYNDKLAHGDVHFFLKTIKNYLQGIYLPKKDRLFWYSQFLVLVNIVRGISGEKNLKIPSPAGHLHINLLPEARGSQWGSKLLQKFESYTKSKGCSTIHADSFLTKRNKNTNFWMKNGFKEYSKVRTNFWTKQIPDEKIFLACYVKNLK